MNSKLSEKIKAKLAELQKASEPKEKKEFTSNFWRPDAGKQVIRILPNKFQPDYPFTELSFYYDFGKAWLAPAVLNQPDPVTEFCHELLKTRTKEDWVRAKKLEPKQRTYVAVLVRGKEEEGVKFWGFSKTIYQKLLSIIDDPDYGDITDLTTGRDVTVEYTPSKKEGEFAKTEIIVKPKETRYTDSEIVAKLVSDMPDVTTVFTVPTYDELKSALVKYLDGTNGEEEQPVQEEKDFDPTKIDPPKGPIDAVKVKTQEEDDVEAAFNAILNSKK